MESIMEGENMPTAPRPQTGPTFEDLTLDDSLDDLQRIMRYSTSSIALQRLVHVKMLATTAKNNGFVRTKECLFPLFDTISSDEEFMLRQHLAEQLRGVAEVCVRDGGEEGYKAMLDSILPILARLVSDNQAEVRIAAGESLVSVAGLVRKEDMGPRVLTVVLQLAHDDENEDLRMTAAVLLNELAETLGPELCHQFVTPEVICLAEDPVFRVRKAAALNLDAVCRTAGPQMAMKRLVPAFLRLCQDDIWGVRKSCAESLVAVSKCLDPQVRVTELIPVFEKFANDQSKWVRNAAFQHLGPFLATLPGAKITPSLLSHYIRMGLAGDATGSTGAAASSTGQAASVPSPTGGVPARLGTEPGDADLAVYCAFSFPAVVMTLGRTRWPELKPLFQSLSRDVQRKVRRPVSHSLHEIARILGPELAESDLLPAFELYLKDVDEVKVGVVRNVAAFLAVLLPSTRESYLPVLDELLSGTAALNWRSRNLLASQLTQLSQIFSPAATFSIVSPFAMKLLVDPIASVREEAVSGFAPLMNRLGQADPAFELDLAVRLIKLATSHCYRERLLFVKLCGYLGHGSTGIVPQLFRSQFLPSLLSLAGDPTRNVRLAVAKLFAPLSSASAYLQQQREQTVLRAAQESSATSPPGPSGKGPKISFGVVSAFVQSGKLHTSSLGGSETAPAASAPSSAESAPLSVDVDMLPTWARRQCEVEAISGTHEFESSNSKSDSESDEDVMASDVMKVLETLVQDADLEIVQTLDAIFVARRRKLPERAAHGAEADIMLTLEDSEPVAEIASVNATEHSQVDGTLDMHMAALGLASQEQKFDDTTACTEPADEIDLDASPS